MGTEDFHGAHPKKAARRTVRPGRPAILRMVVIGGVVLVAVPIFLVISSSNSRQFGKPHLDPCVETAAENQSQTQPFPQQGTWKLNPEVNSDPFFANSYPDVNRAEVANALHIATLVRQVLDIRGFEVYDDGELIGLLPAYYMGFPKAGTTTAYAFMESRLCCMAKGLVKEPHYWYVHFNPRCALASNGRLSDCDRGQIKEAVRSYVRRSLPSIRALQQSGKCSQPYVVDGSTHQMFEPALESRGAKFRERDFGGDVPFDFAVFLHALTPGAKFIAVIRGNCPELLRSIFFYYESRSTATAGTKYKRMLETARETLAAVVERADRCDSMLHLRRFTQSLRAITFGSSCNLNKYVSLFGPGSVFMTDIKAMTACQDGFTDWMGSGAPCVPYTAVKNENGRSEAVLPPYIDALEEEVLLHLDVAHYALQYAGPDQPCARYASDFNHTTESVLAVAIAKTRTPNPLEESEGQSHGTNTVRIDRSERRRRTRSALARARNARERA